MGTASLLGWSSTMDCKSRLTAALDELERMRPIVGSLTRLLTSGVVGYAYGLFVLSCLKGC